MRHELVEDIADRARDTVRAAAGRDDVPDHVRSLTSERVLAVEADLIDSIAARSARPVERRRSGSAVSTDLDPAQRASSRRSPADAGLLVIEGAAGTGKTTTLAAARDVLDAAGRRLVVVTPTLKAAQAAQAAGRHRRVLGRLAHPPARLPVGRGRPLDTHRHRTRAQRRAAARRRPARRRGRHARPGHRPRAVRHRRPSPRAPSRSSATATSSPPSAAAASSTSPHAGPDPKRTTSSSRSTGSATPPTPT